MGRREKRLRDMRRKPKGDWRIEDVEALCRSFDIECEPGAKHYGVVHPSQPDKIVIPPKRPIKFFYIQDLVDFVDRVQKWRAENE